MHTLCRDARSLSNAGGRLLRKPCGGLGWKNRFVVQLHPEALVTPKPQLFSKRQSSPAPPPQVPATRNPTISSTYTPQCSWRERLSPVPIRDIGRDDRQSTSNGQESEASREALDAGLREQERDQQNLERL